MYYLSINTHKAKDYSCFGYLITIFLKFLKLNYKTLLCPHKKATLAGLEILKVEHKQK